MGFGELFLLAIGVSMDAFAVSICKGLAVQKTRLREMATCGIWFGGFQALMPLIGFFLGALFYNAISAFDHWIAFGLLAIIGGNMLKESLEKCDCCETTDASFGFKTMFVMAIATSIDALAVGVTFAFLNVLIVPAISIIGCTTFVLSLVGVVVGNYFGARYKARAELTGGIILVVLGAKILLEHLGILV